MQPSQHKQIFKMKLYSLPLLIFFFLTFSNVAANLSFLFTFNDLFILSSCEFSTSLFICLFFCCNLILKYLLTCLVVTPAYASVASETSMKKENRSHNTIEKSLNELFLTAYYSNPRNSDHASFVNHFVNMAGPYEALTDKDRGCATVKTTQASNNTNPRNSIC